MCEIVEQALPRPRTPLRFALSATTAPNLNVTVEGCGYLLLPPAYGGRRVRLDAFALSGPLEHPVEVEVRTAVRGMDVRFTPVGPLALLGVTAYGLTPRGLPPLSAVVRTDLAPLVRAWRADVLAPPPAGTSMADAFAVRARAIVSFLMARLPEVPPETAFLQQVICRIEATNGTLSVTQLADSLGVSPVTLRRRFAVLGMPVKRFAAVVRFRRALAFLATAPGARLVDVAYRFGYADQSHFVRDHRRFAGTPPTRWGEADRLFDGPASSP